MMRICNTCKKEYPLNVEHFHCKKRNKCGFNTICKYCVNLNYKKYDYSDKRKKYYKENNRIILDKKRDYYYKNKERIRKSQKDYYYENIEYHRKRCRAYNSYDSEKAAKRFQDKYNNDVIFRISHNVRARINNVFKDKGYTKKSKTYEIIGTDFKTFYNHLCSTFEENYGLGRQYIPWKEVHIDHKVPLSLAECEEDVYKLNHYNNLQLLFFEDNLSKSNKLDYIL